MSQERLNGFAMCNIEKAILDTIDLNTVLMILHQEMPEEVPFCEPMDIMECKFMVIKLILEVQINYLSGTMIRDTLTRGLNHP